MESYGFQEKTDVVVKIDMDEYNKRVEDATAEQNKIWSTQKNEKASDQQTQGEFNDVPPIKKSWFDKFMSYFRYSHDSEKKKESYFKQFYNSLPNLRGYFTRGRATGGYRRLKMSRTVKRMVLER